MYAILKRYILRIPFSNYSHFSPNATFYVSTPIFYVNAPPHLGHLYSAVLADAAYRFHVLQHGNENAIFSTGTDEHGLKIQNAAASANTPVEMFCDHLSQRFKDLFDCCDIKYTHFVKTSQEKHARCVQHFWKTIDKNGFIYSGNYQGWYCTADECFLSEDQLNSITNEDGSVQKYSKESNQPVQWTQEENFIFRLSHFRDDLLRWLNEKDAVKPNKFHKLLNDLIADDNVMRDISISRPKSRIFWGVPVPGCPSQTVYVWMDALVNYLTVAGYESTFDGDGSMHWPATVQVCGKDILKFHGIYWPAFLMAAGLEPPHRLFVHSHWMVNDQKMSKSKGNVVDPVEKIAMFGASGIRYFLLKEGVAHSDGNYNDYKAKNMMNADLANNVGNLLKRCTGEILNPTRSFPSPWDDDDLHRNLLETAAGTGATGPEYDVARQLMLELASLPEAVGGHYEAMDFYRGLEVLMNTLRSCNKFFEAAKPWKLCKNIKDEGKLIFVIYLTLETLRICSIALQPVVPDISRQLFNKLSIPEGQRMWIHMKPSWEGKYFKSRSLSEEDVILYRKHKN